MPSLHPKTPRRVVILLLGTCLLIGSGAAIYFVRQNQIERELRAIRAEGIAALEREDYPTALASLKRYVARHRDDAGALFAYGVARARVEDANGDRHIKQPIEIFRTVLRIEPNNRAAQRMLLEMYSAGNFNSEAVSLADELLEEEPDHPATLKAKATALQRLDRWEEAAAVGEHLNTVAPSDLSAQLQTLAAYRELRKPPEEVLARAQAMKADHPDDPRFDLLLAIAVGGNGEMSRAVAMLRNLSTTATPPDAEFVRVFSSILERNGMLDESNALLKRVAAGTDDPDILSVYAQRQWQDGAFLPLAERLAGIDPKNPESSSELLAYRALSLLALDRDNDAAPILDALARRVDDPRATCWAIAIKTHFADPPIEGRDAIEQYRDAIARDPRNAVARFYLGEVYDRLGEKEPAIQSYERAAALAPSWSHPHGRIARAYAATGRMGEAVEHANEALSAAPSDLYANVTHAVVTYVAQGIESADSRDLLTRVAAIQRQRPLEPETLPIYVALLSGTGQRQQAMDIVRQVLASPTTASTTQPAALEQSAILRLVSVSRSERLGMEQQLLELLERAHANQRTPALALAQATVLAGQGRPIDGLNLLLEAAREAGTDTTTATEPIGVSASSASMLLQWQLAIAEYREYIGDPNAAADWIALGDAYPTDLQVQSSILKLAESIRSDRGFVDRTINRVLALTGQEGMLWRIERARWLLDSNQQKELSEAVRILNDIVDSSPTLIEPRLLLASALEKVGNLTQAIRELQAAIDQQPNRPAIVLELARLEQRVGRFDDALNRLNRLSQSADSLSTETVRRVATLLERQGEFSRALSLLETIYPASTTTPSEADNAITRETAARLLLARLYRRVGRFVDAQSIYNQLLERSSPEPEVIHAAAEFHARRDNFTTAQAILGRLPQAQLRPGVRELILADFNDKFGQTKEAAREYYQAATLAAPGDANTWREYAAFLLRNGRWQEALNAVDQGRQALPTDQRLLTLRSHIAAMARVQTTATESSAGASGSGAAFDALIDALAHDPENPQAPEILQLLLQARSGAIDADEVTAGLRTLLNEYPQNQVIHLELVRRYRAVGRLDDAADAALRAMKLLPNDARVAEVAVEVLRDTVRIDDLEVAARQWQSRTQDEPLRADLALADALLRQGRVGDALATLARHVNPSSGQPPADAVEMQARALIAGDRTDEARQLLEPLLLESRAWRQIWLELASTALSDPESAMTWIEHLERQTPGNGSADDKLLIAAAWQMIGSGFELQGARDKARAILDPLSQNPEAPASTWSILAMLDEAADDLDAAEQNYRRAVANSASDPSTLNNLAYFLLMHRSSEANHREALELAQRAVRERPNDASFHDTLARALARLGEDDAALAHFQRAIDLDPRSLDALIGKAKVLVDLQRISLAESVVRQIDQILEQAASRPAARPAQALSAALAEELRTVRHAMDADAAALR